MKSNFKVGWKPKARNALAQLWLDYPERRADLTRLIDFIDNQLSNNPLLLGEGRDGNSRVWILEMLVVSFDVTLDDNRVRVTSIHAH